MVNPYIKDFLHLIRHGSNSNSYKLVWAKAIVEIATEHPTEQVITLNEIAKKVFKYYWNQTIYFDLIQGNNPNFRPEFVTEVRNTINEYFQQHNTRQPIHFEKVESVVELNLKKLVRILKTDVSWRFLKVKKEIIPVYQYQKGDDQLIVPYPELLANYSDILHEAINFKWTQILETFNSVPRIAKKVRIVDFPDIKRKSLTPFKKFLSAENPEHKCFVCNKPISDKQLSIDHVIPWSFLFSDDLWNLVYLHRGCNSSKSNIIPNEQEIIKLEARNKRLFGILGADGIMGTKKVFKELEIAINRDYVRKFWINCKS